MKMTLTYHRWGTTVCASDSKKFSGVITPIANLLGVRQHLDDPESVV